MEQITRTFCVILFSLLYASSGIARPYITAERYGNSQSVANLNEIVLTTPNAHSSSFGKLYSHTVDGSDHAQPLRNLTVPNLDARNVSFIVAMNDVGYAFDANSNFVNVGILWETDFRDTATGVMSVPITDVGDDGLNTRTPRRIESAPVRVFAYNAQALKQTSEYCLSTATVTGQAALSLGSYVIPIRFIR
jgi:hypothetical protein